MPFFMEHSIVLGCRPRVNLSLYCRGASEAQGEIVKGSEQKLTWLPGYLFPLICEM